jgi:RNase P/RNase MRP subunit p30
MLLWGVLASALRLVFEFGVGRLLSSRAWRHPDGHHGFSKISAFQALCSRLDRAAYPALR